MAARLRLQRGKQPKCRKITKLLHMEVCDAKRLRELEAENAKLKKLLAESALDVEALKVALGRKR